MSERHVGGEPRRPTYQRSSAWRTRVIVRRVIALLGIILLAALIFIYANKWQPQTPPQCSFSQFITAQRTVLCVNAQPLRLIGYNARWIGTGCSMPTDAQLDQTFAQIQQTSNANIIRTAFYQSGSNSGSYADFDRYIAAAKRHHLYILPILANQWTNCEPSVTTKTAAWYQSGYKVAGDGYPLSYRDYVRRLVAHYASEPTIALWQLINEPDTTGAPCGASAAQTLRAFADDMTSVIKSVDPHHLVDLGVPGGCAGDTPADYRTIVAGSVGVADVWHDYDKVMVPMPLMLRERVQVLQALHKPAFIGESGICADVGPNGACDGVISQASLARRASFFDAKLTAGFGIGLSGYIIWNMGPQSMQYDIGPGDPTERVLARYALTNAATASA